MNITFIQATTQDHRYLLWLRKCTMVTHLEQAGLFYSDEQHVAKLCEDFNCAHIIWIDEVKVGLLKFSCCDGQLNIKQFQLEPTQQGKGFGRKIMQYLMATNTHKMTVLTVLKQNPAKRLYLSLGFKVVGEDQYEYHMQKRPN